jgi:hypothetical protein
VPAAAAVAWPDEFEERPEAEEELEEPEAPAKPRRARRRWRLPGRRVWLTLAVLLIGAGGAGAYWWFQPQLPLPKWSTVTSTWTAFTSKVSALTAKLSALKAKFRRAPAAPTPAPTRQQPKPTVRPVTPPAGVAPAPARPAPTPPAAAPPPPSPFARLDLIGDSLTGAVRNFGERSALYARGQLPCAGLARGLAAVESRWLAYNTARRNAGALDATRSARDQALYAGVDSVERRFEQSGCPRP